MQVCPSVNLYNDLLLLLNDIGIGSGVQVCPYLNPFNDFPLNVIGIAPYVTMISTPIK